MGKLHGSQTLEETDWDAAGTIGREGSQRLGWAYSHDNTDVVTQFIRCMTELLESGGALGVWPSEQTNGRRSYGALTEGS